MSFYSITEQTGSAKVFNVGIIENVQLLSIKNEPSKADGTGDTVLRFVFQGQNNESFTHTEFPVNEEQVKKFAAQFKQDPNTAIKSAYEDLGARIKHILSAFIPENQVVIQANGWEDYCTKVVALAGNLYQAENFRFKLVLNNKDFPSFPKKTVSPWIQNMKDTNALRINPKYDRLIAKAPSAENALPDPYGLDNNTGTTGGGVLGLDDEF